MATLMIGLAAGLPAAAQMPDQAQPVCKGDPAPLPPELAGWTARAPLDAAADGARAKRARLTIGKGANLALLPTPKIRYPVRPEKPGGSVSHGGIVAFRVASAGSYRVALGSAAWIEVVGRGKAVASTAHGHGPDCSGIRKMVDFALQPGDYLLEIAGNGEPAVAAMVARLP